MAKVLQDVVQLITLREYARARAETCQEVIKTKTLKNSQYVPKCQEDMGVSKRF